MFRSLIRPHGEFSTGWADRLRMKQLLSSRPSEPGFNPGEREPGPNFPHALLHGSRLSHQHRRSGAAVDSFGRDDSQFRCRRRAPGKARSRAPSRAMRRAPSRTTRAAPSVPTSSFETARAQPRRVEGSLRGGNVMERAIWHGNTSARPIRPDRSTPPKLHCRAARAAIE
jgi:hypothetical protein